MKISRRIVAPLCALALAAVSAQAQFYKLHNADFGGGAIGQFTTPLTSNYTPNNVVERTHDTVGALFTVRDHPFAFAGLEFNYAFNDFNATYQASTYVAPTKIVSHEATAAYLIHPHFRKLQPFIGIGGGYTDFVPTSGQNQWRGTGLLEAGLDIPTSNPHFGFRIQGRELVYRAPNFYQPQLATKQWVSTEEPSVGVYLRY